jgi:hypothetical protein
VVVAANFLIDAESNLKAAIGGFAGHSSTQRLRHRRIRCDGPNPQRQGSGHQAQGKVEE